MFVHSADVREFSVVDLRPTQPAAGYAAAEAGQFQKFRLVDNEEKLHARLKQEKPLRVVLGPGGAVFLTDGHHRALGIFRASMAICETSRPGDQTNACMAGVRVRVRVDGDYSEMSWSNFLEILVKENNIYLPREIREKLDSGKLSAEMLFKQPGGLLPPNIGKLANDPMRSAIGTLFYHQGISGDLFINYIEFMLAERVDSKVKVEPGFESDIGVQMRLTKEIFGNPSMVKYLRCKARQGNDSWNKAQRQINNSVGLEASHSFEPSFCQAP